MMRMKAFVMGILMSASVLPMEAQQATPPCQMERLTRGVVALPAQDGKGIFVSWRVLGTDKEDVVFDVQRDGQTIAHDLHASNFTDREGTAQSQYRVVVRSASGSETTPAITPWGEPFKRIQLSRPEGGQTVDGRPYEYTPNDCSVGDVDGDGEYELIVKWDPSNSRDNSGRGYTGRVIIDAYRMDGTQLWRINLGDNIRAGAHYTQFMVYDLDGDGKAEMVCKTAPGSVDGKGHYVTEAADDEEIRKADNQAFYPSDRSVGHVLGGPEYLTVFSGLTGEAVHTIFYRPNRAFGVGGAPESGNWGDARKEDRYGNRGERYLACVAYLDGADKNPSVVMCRGYYTRSYLWAVDFDGKQLKHKWLHGSISPTTVEVTDAKGKVRTYKYKKNTGGVHKVYTAYAQGAHGLCVGDVDGDGCDEITYGNAAIDNDGKLLYSTGYGHGDAFHLSDLDPDRPGLEYFMVHEAHPYGWNLRDARTGEVIYYSAGHLDNGRGLAADVDSVHRGFEFWSIEDGNMRDIRNEVIGRRGSINFRIYWDGDLQDELFDGRFGGRGRGNPGILKWNAATGQWDDILINGKRMVEWGNSRSCNFTKSTPNLQADLMGDWREEVILFDALDPSVLNVFTTNIPTPYRVPTLMHDHIYRMGIVWQNVAYNQPPHLGYYLPDSVKK